MPQAKSTRKTTTAGPDPSKPSCSSCAHALPTEITRTDDDGAESTERLFVCRRFPPSLIAHGGQVLQLWPEMRAEQWCSEWAERS